MKKNLTRQIIENHLVDGSMIPEEEISIRIDQTLTQDATGTLVMLELEAMGLERSRAEVSVQYVDHNLLQEDNRNPDDHLFLQSACRRFGIWFSPPGNGVSHPVHQQSFGKPGKTLVGSDSHTPAAGALGMLAVGAGGLEVAMAIAGEPLYLNMPKVWGIELTESLPKWVSAKDVILELLRRHGVEGGIGYVLEYFGPGLRDLTAMDRHVIANMGTELGATSTVFPSDEQTRRYLRGQGRESDWIQLDTDSSAGYERQEQIDLSKLEPLVAKPSSPGNVVPVREVAGEEIHQVYIGSSANPGFRDFAIVADIVSGKRVHKNVSFDINPSSRQTLADLTRRGHLGKLIAAGARIHQAGCNGCIGMGQAPATDKNSLRTVPRNFPGRSGTREDKVFLVSPETAAASALAGVITDPRDLDMDCPQTEEPETHEIEEPIFDEPLAPEAASQVELVKGPNIVSLPEFDELPEQLEVRAILKVGDDISTDGIMPAGARVLPYRSNVPRIADFCFDVIDETYPQRARECRDQGGHAIVGGRNYGQGSSREHAALAPRYLGLRLVIAKSFARIHQQNLVNFGILPLTFDSPETYDILQSGTLLRIREVKEQLAGDNYITVECPERGNAAFDCKHRLSPRQLEIIFAGGLIKKMATSNPQLSHS